MQAISITLDDVDLEVLTAGDEGPLAVCLHGFPDTAHTWRHLAPVLVDAGFRVAAPFLRGYAPSAVPADGRVEIAASALDAIALHDRLGHGRPGILIGHDWGAVAAHGAAVAAPERWAGIVTSAVPPGPALTEALLGDLDQLWRSWYFFFFQHPLADLVVPARDHAFIERIWRDWSPGYDPDEDLVAVRKALGTPEHLDAALGAYRCALGTRPTEADLEPWRAATAQYPSIPHLYLHGYDDGCIGVDVAERSRAAAPATTRFVTIEQAGHFAHLERPDIVHALIRDFVTALISDTEVTP